MLGFRIRPIKQLTILLDGELGRTSRPFTPISDQNYDVFRSRIEYKAKSYRLAVFAKTDYNTNSNSLTSFCTRSTVSDI